MSAKALLDSNPAPGEDEIKKALRGNICRCTGYKKIIEAIQLTAAILRGEEAIDADLELGADYGVGQKAFRVDVREKVLGYGKYPDDIYMEGMVHASAVRSAYPRARILKIDSSGAEAMPGVLGVLTCRWKSKNEKLWLEGRYSLLRYFDRDEIGSGLQRILSPWKNDLSFQLRVKI